MSIWTDHTSDEYLSVAAPVTTYPFSVGMWGNILTNQTNGTIWGLSDTGSTNHSFRLEATTPTTVILRCVGGGSTASADPGSTTVTAGRWFYMIGRFISATERRISACGTTHSPIHGVSTTSVTPTGIDTMTLGQYRTSAGAVSPFNGLIAEFWMTDTDIWESGADLDNDMFWRIMKEGPLSVSRVRKDLIDYRSFYAGSPRLIGENIGWCLPWDDNGGVKVGTHAHIHQPIYRSPANVFRNLQV